MRKYTVVDIVNRYGIRYATMYIDEYSWGLYCNGGQKYFDNNILAFVNYVTNIAPYNRNLNNKH